MNTLLDVQKGRVVPEPTDAAADRALECDILIAGGGMGGCAAALTACLAGKSVVLTEETDWLGGQMTSQGVAALDEHRYIETFGGTRTYQELRWLIRRYYSEQSSLSASARQLAALNPGNGWVSHLCFEPRAALWALEQLLGPHAESGRLTVLRRYKASSAHTEGDCVRSVRFRNLDGGDRVEVRASFVLDATELGDLLPLTGTEYVSGAESRVETGEPSAREGEAAPHCVQSFTFPFAVELREGERHYVREPDGYQLNRERQPYTLSHLYPEKGWVTYRMFETGEGAAGPFWTYRRLLDARNFEEPGRARDVAMINWPGNDFRHGNIIDVPAEEALGALQQARSLSLGFLYWLQSECPRDEGGTGYPELLPRGDVMGTEDGLSKFPYIRESRRIRSLYTIVEQDISAVHQGGPRARLVSDSIGIGLYAIDIHPAEGEEKIPPAAAHPFQIPLGALVPVRMKNLLPACKNIGTTHITNGAYRLHPVEWNIGESAAHLALFCLDRSLTPQEVAEDSHRLRRLQRRLARAGVPLHWYVDLPVEHPAFVPAQVLAAWGVWQANPEGLDFGPDDPARAADLQALSQAPRWARERIERVLRQALPAWSSHDRMALAHATYEALNI